MVNIIIVANGVGSVTPMICSSANLMRFVVRSFLRSGFYKALEEIQGPHYPARPSQTKILTGSPNRSRPPSLIPLFEYFRPASCSPVAASKKFA